METVSIFSIPREIILLILKNDDLSACDVLNFGATCKFYNHIVHNDQNLWRIKMKSIAGKRLFKIVESQDNVNWISEMKTYHKIKVFTQEEINSMSSKCYRQTAELTFADVANFFEKSLIRETGLYTIITILSQLVKISSQSSLTVMYYSKSVLQCLIHSYLMMEWVIKNKYEAMTSDKVTHLFLQWIDTSNIHSLDDIDNLIAKLANEVKDSLEESHPLKTATDDEKAIWSKAAMTNNAWDPISCKHVLNMVKQVLFDKHRINSTTSCSLDNIDFVKVWKIKVGNLTVVASLFEAVARRCGVKCELVAFTNHMFLDWQEDYANPASVTLSIDLKTGELKKKLSCPYSQGNYKRLSYCPMKLLQHYFASFNRTMGAIRNWNTKNAVHLLEISQTHATGNNLPYRNFLHYILIRFQEHDDQALLTELKFEHLADVHADCMLYATKFNNPGMFRSITVKRHPSTVKYSVGLICSHLRYEYVCVVRGWDEQCIASTEWQQRMGIHTLLYGPTQPFYRVLAVDDSERYVAQENLVVKKSAGRLYHLEDTLGKEFTDFDGFSYVPNEEMVNEYPDDKAITEMYKKTHYEA